MPGDRSQPYEWWGGYGEPLSLVQLLEAETLDLPLASLLWLAMEHRASVIVAASPRLAGKTTLLTALIDFLRPEVQRIYLQGRAEDYDFLPQVEPRECYLLVNELSYHLPAYLWGQPARRLFELLPLGFGMGATMHADTAEEVVAILEQTLGVPGNLVGQVTLVVNLELQYGSRGYQYLRRRVIAASLLSPDGEALPTSTLLARRDPHRDAWLVKPGQEALEALAVRLGLDPQEMLRELPRREAMLCQWLEQGVRLPAQVRQAVQQFYRESAE